MVQRLKTAKEGWFEVAKIMYVFIGLPCALFVGIPSIFVVSSIIQSGQYWVLFFCSILWLAVLIPMAIFIYGVISRRRFLRMV